MSKPLSEKQVSQVLAIISECGFSQLLSVMATDCELRQAGANDAGNKLRARQLKRLFEGLDAHAELAAIAKI